MNHPFSEDMRKLREHYTDLYRKHGDTAGAAQWSSLESQEHRMSILADVMDRNDATVLDFGCGTGRLLEFLRRERGYVGSYTGLDLCPGLIEAAASKHPEARWICRDILSEPLGGRFDYVFISGVFNNRMQDNAAFMRQVLSALSPLTDRALAFNALSTYVEYFSEGLYYADPEEVFRFCKERLSSRVTLRHEYFIKPDAPPFEFTIYVHAGASPIVKKETDS